MTASYRLIDYSVRPAKHAERRMLCDAFRRLSKFGAVEHYQYVGFGAIWFSDFSLFHRALGISRMYCIEREVHHRERFEFNKPFGGIEMMFGRSSQELPKIDWRRRTICWLDYDDQLNVDILADARTVANAATSGTAIFVSLQASTKPTYDVSPDEKAEVETVEKFREVFGARRTPNEMTMKDLSAWRMSRLYRDIVVNEINDALIARNSTLPAGQRLSFRQIVSMEYADGAKMATIGGVFVEEGQEAVFNACDFERLPFFRANNENAVRIEIPKLTPKEMRAIEKLLPADSIATLACEPAPGRDARAFALLYRYLPSFASFDP
ncbi:O-methyltransferase [Sinorhizobium sp. GL28]|uniref:O-methyltransferase n=1 Tax=Sinorhizobium sp. GL28 TaxID=1358418 RepID=UPI0012E39BDE|nr:O-methyltransferase [Sinorhizobium sp. GL28]